MSEKTVLRKSPRAVLNQPIHLLGELGIILNASISGARIKIRTDDLPLSLDQKVEIEWPPLLNSKNIILPATCVWIGDKEIGVRFEKLHAKAKCVIEAMVRFHRF